jgi:NADPH:quinone reductase-like Zn-dependent oxidoreductase
MKAFGLADEGSSAGFLEIPVPEVGPGEVRIAVRASSVNGFDAVVAAGMARGMMEHRYPVVVGKDFAGVIETLGDGAAGFAVGDDVAGITPQEPFVSRGSFAEYLVVPAEGFIARRPAAVEPEQAASVGLAATSALLSVEAIEPSDGDLVLIVGATGGVGAYAIQLAAARGATVIATGLPGDEAWLKELGADEVVDYSGDDAAAVRERHPEGVDALIDAVYLGDGFDTIAALVKDGGKIASVVGSADEALASRGIAATNVNGQEDPVAFAKVLEMAAGGALTVPITRTFTFEDLPEALGLSGKRHRLGKLAVTITS